MCYYVRQETTVIPRLCQQPWESPIQEEIATALRSSQ